jgi:hypothetical protein
MNFINIIRLKFDSFTMHQFKEVKVMQQKNIYNENITLTLTLIDPPNSF